MNFGVLGMLHLEGGHVDVRPHDEREVERDDALNARTKSVRNVLFVSGSKGAHGEEGDVFEAERGVTVDQRYWGVGRND